MMSNFKEDFKPLQGLISLLLYNDYEERSEEYKHPTFLRFHPFDKPFPKERFAIGMNQVVSFFGFPGYTDVSVKNFGKSIAEALIHYAWNDIKISELRKYICESSTNYPGIRDIYFEVVFKNMIYMCGGCTDHGDGVSQTGRERLESIFELLSTLSKIKVQSITVEASKYDKYKQKIIHAIEEA